MKAPITDNLSRSLVASEMNSALDANNYVWISVERGGIHYIQGLGKTEIQIVR